MRHQSLILLLASATLPAFALDTTGFHDNQERSLSCQSDHDNWGEHRSHFCEVREQTIAPAGMLSIDAGQNGGIAIKGWSGNQILVRAKVEGSGASPDDAHAIVSSVAVHATPGDIRATGPEMHDNQGWSVSFEVFVPHLTNLTATAHNGGLSISDVAGEVHLHTQNGGLHVARIAGDVTGETVNGGVHADLIGSRWDGRGLDLSSTNGGVSVRVPQNYSAQLEANTTNGGVHSDLPELASPDGRHRVTLSGALGSGGAPVHLTTVNGGVSVTR